MAGQSSCLTCGIVRSSRGIALHLPSCRKKHAAAKAAENDPHAVAGREQSVLFLLSLVAISMNVEHVHCLERTASVTPRVPNVDLNLARKVLMEVDLCETVLFASSCSPYLPHALHELKPIVTPVDSPFTRISLAQSSSLDWTSAGGSH